ncbi:PREDICTED: rapid alkalinization factor 23-like [Nicotiana attenuata]|uniref:rapid alkalinization factor 23-like n=1 Tax=Nicotiana attenuata TaxID=49451 RepID=UPI0009046CC1|nr:PREDICTED: rapid alkalinization factor 23-like [Nicotiana attenuata]
MDLRVEIILLVVVVMNIDPISSHKYGNTNFGHDFGDHAIAISSRGRRILQAEDGYISYAALSADTIPCNVRGASYYDCSSHVEINPYRRGCSEITRCARSNS